jgi:hypothetical protein
MPNLLIKLSTIGSQLNAVTNAEIGAVDMTRHDQND